MSLVDDVLGYLKTNYDPAPGDFSRFNFSALAESLRLSDLGRERGAKNQPPSSATELDTVEQDLAEAMRRQALLDETRTREELDHYLTRLKAASPAGQSGSMFLEAQGAVAEFRNTMLSARAILDRERKNVLEREKQVSVFRADHGLRRPPNPPRNHLLMALVLAVCFVGEVALSASVLQAASDFGLLGGIAIAFFYTFISMGLALILGLVILPYLIHRLWVWKSIALIGTPIAIAGILYINLLAAHYRIAVTSGLLEAQAGKVASQTMWSNPTAFLDDTQAIALIGASFIIVFITVAEGLLWRDPYPGYSRVNSFYLKAHNRWVKELDIHGGQLEDIYQEALDRIRSKQASFADRQSEIPQILGNRRRVVRNFNIHRKHIQDCGRFLMETYREANREIRKAAPPRYFSKAWEIDSVDEMDSPPDSDAGDPSIWQDIGKQLKEASSELHAAHKEADAWIKQLMSSASAAHADAEQAAQGREAGARGAESRPGQPSEEEPSVRQQRSSLTLIEGGE